MAKYYAVKVGLTPGIYSNWQECQANVIGYPGAKYKSFSTLEEASQFVYGDNGKKEDGIILHLILFGIKVVRKSPFTVQMEILQFQQT